MSFTVVRQKVATYIGQAAFTYFISLPLPFFASLYNHEISFVRPFKVKLALSCTSRQGREGGTRRRCATLKTRHRTQYLELPTSSTIIRLCVSEYVT